MPIALSLAIDDNASDVKETRFPHLTSLDQPPSCMNVRVRFLCVLRVVMCVKYESRIKCHLSLREFGC